MFPSGVFTAIMHASAMEWFALINSHLNTPSFKTVPASTVISSRSPEKLVLSQLAFDDSESKSCSVNRYVYAFEQVRKTADMVSRVRA